MFVSVFCNYLANLSPGSGTWELRDDSDWPTLLAVGLMRTQAQEAVSPGEGYKYEECLSVHGKSGCEQATGPRNLSFPPPSMTSSLVASAGGFCAANPREAEEQAPAMPTFSYPARLRAWERRRPLGTRATW